MIDDPATTTTAPHEAAAGGQTPLGALIGEVKALAFDARTMVEAELAFERKRVAFVLRSGRSIGVLVLVALVLAWFALIALVVGLLMIATKAFGPVIATLIVTGGLLVVAGICLFLALSQFRKAKHELTGSAPA